MLTIVRGPVVVGTGTFESLLADKYGMPLGSSTTTVFDQKIFPKVAGSAPLWTNSGTGPAVLSATATISRTVRPTDLVGRVLTLAERGRRVTSHRIVRAASTTVTTNAASTTFDLILDRPPGNRGLWAIYGEPAGSYSTDGSRFIINGREFAGTGSSLADPNEPWDGFDDRNLFLAHVRSSSSSIAQSEVVRGSFLRTAADNSFTLFGTTYRFDGADSAPGTPITATTDVDGDFIPDGADNDGDGVIDGVFQDFGIPPVSDGAGNRVDLRASVLVVDLDGRFNINAHGSLAPIVYGTNHAGWSTDAAIAAALPSVPLGSGYGPADIQANLGLLNSSTSPAAAGSVPRLFDTGTLAPGENPRWNLTVGGTATTLTGVRPTGSRYAVGVETPRVGNLAGKYGEQPPSVVTTGSAQLVSDPNFPFARPGVPYVDDRVSQIAIRRVVPIASGSNDTVNYGIPPLWWTGTAGYNWGISETVSGTTQPLPRGVYNSPPDLHGRMKTLTLAPEGSGLTPRLVFAQPEWSAPGVARETADDPYEIMLDTRYRPGGMLVDPTGQTATDNPFTPAELEPVLRPYDIDTNRLPPRLAAMLGSAAEESRLEVTTDSWDTTAITGSAALLLFGTQGGATGWLQRPAFDSLVVTDTSSPLLGILGAEVARGERFDLNRPLTASGTANVGYDINNVYYRQRQAYFKDLFTLLVALNQGSGTSSPSILADNARIAQWTANVIEFRDADSIMTPFECDLDPSNANGWAVDGDVQTDEGVPDRVVVFGAERPEILIAETLAWERVDSGTTGGLCISLHRPWNAVATGTGSEQIPAEPCDYAFDTLAATGTLNVVDLGKKPLNSGAYPIWRLRITTASGTQFVRFDTTTSGTTNELLVSGTGRLPVDTTLTVYSSTSLQVGTNPRTLTLSGSTLAAVTSGSFRVAGGPAGPAFSAPIRTGSIFLERLANPSGTATAEIWSAPPLVTGTTSGTSAQQYVVVDSGTLSICNTGTQVLPVPELTSTVRVVTGSAAPWRSGTTTTPTVTNNFPTFPSLGTDGARWMPWPNRPFVSSAELILVPRGGAMAMLTNYQPATPAAALPVTGTNGIPVDLPLLFDAVHVPTRFAGIHQTGTTVTTTLTGAGIFSTGSNAITTVNQFSSFREPGRVNLNTVTSDDVWNAVVAGPLPRPVVSRTASTITTTGTPAQNMYAALSLASGTSTVIVSDTNSAQLEVDRNPLHGIYTATRLGNTTTPRSNVFAIWITLRESVANDPDSVKYHRAFYIVDRSIPVAFEEGRDYNVWDCIRLRRFIE